MISIALPQAECDEFLAEAADLDISPTELARRIIRGRTEQTIVISPDAERIHEKFAGIVAQLKEDKTELLDRLTASERSGGLAGVETKEMTTKEIIKEAQKGWQNELMKAELTKLQAEEKTTTARIKELEEELKQAQETIKADQRIQTYLQAGGTMLGEFVSKNPALGERIATQGVSGLLFGAGNQAGALGASLTSDQQQDLKLGSGIRHDFAGELYGTLIALLFYFKAKPVAMSNVVRSAAFKEYVQSRNAGNPTT